MQHVGSMTRWSDGPDSQERADDRHENLPLPQDSTVYALAVSSAPIHTWSMLGIEWRFVRWDLERWIQDTQTRYLGNS